MSAGTEQDHRAAQDHRMVQGRAGRAPDPVLVIGAGPAGLTAAMELARSGVPVRLVDQATGPATTSRALAVQARTLELLDQRGVGASMVAEGNPARAVALYARGRRLARIDLTRIPSRHASMLLLSQARTEALLREEVQRQGVAVEWGTGLTAFAQHSRGVGVHAVLTGPDGALEEVEASYLISAEGSHSTVRTTLGLPFAGKNLPQRFALGDVDLDADLPQDQVSIFKGAGGFLALFPMGGGHHRVLATDPRGRGADAPVPLLGELQEAWDRVTLTPGRLHDLTWSSRFAITSRHLSTLRVGSVFLGGDAAHVHSPAGGQGMNTGIQDMIDLSWKIAAVLRGEAGDELLDTYADARLPIIRALVSTTERATDLVTASSRAVGSLVEGLPLVLGVAAVQRRGVAIVSQVAAGYRSSPLAGGRRNGLVRRPALAGLRGGDRVPDLSVVLLGDRAMPEEPAAPTTLYRLLDVDRPTVVAVHPAATAGAAGDGPASWRAAVAPWDALVTTLDVALDPSADDGALAGAGLLDVLRERGGLLLVRPDAYVATLAPLGDPAPLTAWLGRWLRRPGDAARASTSTRQRVLARGAAA